MLEAKPSLTQDKRIVDTRLGGLGSRMRGSTNFDVKKRTSEKSVARQNPACAFRKNTSRYEWLCKIESEERSEQVTTFFQVRCSGRKLTTLKTYDITNSHALTERLGAKPTIRFEQQQMP